jgi:hypothetical protein
MKNKDLLKRSPIYDTIYMQMLSYQYAYLGGLPFKQLVRKKRPSEDSTLWTDLVTNTIAQPICRYIVDTINDVLFEPGIKRNVQFCTPTGAYINPKNAEWADLFLLDADLNNRSLTSFMENIGDLTSIYGHCWVAVDMPQASEGNLGRPYVCAINPLDVWDWEFDYYGGKPMLKYVKIKEMEEEDCYYIKCYHLGDAVTPSHWRSYEVPKSVNGSEQLNYDAQMIGEGFFPPGMSIPVFIAYGRRDPRTIDFGISDIDNATDAQREHYKLECEKYTALQFAHTIIRAEKGVSIPVHAGAIVRASEGQVEAIPVDTGDVDKIIKAQQDILEQIEALSGLGGLRNTKNQIASGVAIIEERKQLHRLAKAKARLMEVTEEMIFTFAARFMDMRWAGEVNYNTDYEAHDTNYRMALISKANEMVGDNEIIKSLITKEIIAMLAPAEEIPEYENAYIQTLPKGDLKTLMTENNEQINSRDLAPSMIPKHEMFGETDDQEEEQMVDNGDGVAAHGDNTSILGGAGTPVTNVGMTYYPQQVPPVLLNTMNIGR